MFESKYSKVLTVILVIVILAIIALLGFLGYDYYQKYVITKNTSDFVDNFQGEVSDEDSDNNEDPNNEIEDDPFANIEETERGSGSSAVQTYQGFKVVRNDRNSSNRH